jgi:hypothetical protein
MNRILASRRQQINLVFLRTYSRTQCYARVSSAAGRSGPFPRRHAELAVHPDHVGSEAAGFDGTQHSAGLGIELLDLDLAGIHP